MVLIRTFQPKDREAVSALVLGIQRDEFGMAIGAEDQPDLMDVEGFYGQGKGNFWVACASERIVGTIGLLDIGEGNGALRKMFVAPEWRGHEQGVARQLLETLMAWAAGQGLRHVYLGTTAAFHAAHRFYEREGFERVEQQALPPAFPLMAVDSYFYWRPIAQR